MFMVGMGKKVSPPDRSGGDWFFYKILKRLV